MAFPTTFTNAVDTVTEILAEHINALEVKVGVDSDPNINSLDYRMRLVDVIDKIWVYMNSAPTGWSILSGPADCVLSVKGGANAYNAAGGTLVGTWTQPDHSHDYTTVIAHVHSVDPPATASGNQSASHYHACDPLNTTSSTETNTHYHYCTPSESYSDSVGASHSHGFTTGYSSANHTHSVTTGGASASHTHSISGGFWADGGPTANIATHTPAANITVRGVTDGPSADHTHSGTTSTVSADHTHSGSTSTETSTNHRHYTTTPPFNSATQTGTHTHTTDIAAFNSGNQNADHTHTTDIASFSSESTGSASGTSAGGATANTHRPYAANGIVIERT